MLRNKLRAMLTAQKKDSRIYLYNQGDTCDSITGGWTVISDADLDDKSMILSHASGGQNFRLTTNNPIDLTDKLLCIETIETDAYTPTFYYLAFDLNTNAELIRGTRYTVATSAQRGEFITKKISVKNGSFYVRIASYFGVWRINKIWLEDKDVI